VIDGKGNINFVFVLNKFQNRKGGIDIKDYTSYTNPLITRYASKEMSYIFSDEKKFSTWRKLWVALAKSEKELGLNISDEQIDEMERNIFNIDFDMANQKEKEFRHDVMAHIHTYGAQCPHARSIIHLGATSAYVGDNTDIIQMREALELTRVKLINLMHELAKFAMEYKDMPTLGYTHFQPAQLTTVGKRASLWLQDLYFDYCDLEYVLSGLKLRGAKGTTGTQASFLSLFDGDSGKVARLDSLIAEKMGFEGSYDVTGQTYSRKIDVRVTNVLSGIAQSLHKMTNDFRLLQSLKEIEEPFESHQIGSSAMAYKRNPMRSERIASLARFIINTSHSTEDTASTQWFERTLDDSANKRLTIPQSFLGCDAILAIAINIFQGIIVNEKVVQKHIDEELPFMATENIIMESVKNGGDRQDLHEEIRVLSMEAAEQVKKHGQNNDLIDRVIKSDKIKLTEEDIYKIIDPKKFIGRSAQQVEEFINDKIEPILQKNKKILGIDVDLKV
jgi:adenylosuccinate lyase